MSKKFIFGGSFTSFVFDPDALIYFAANSAITLDADKLAIDTFYKGLKSDGVYTKMKAMYFPKWSSAANNKWNLVNPVDSDAAFRLSFNGGWTHASTGATPNGTNAYAGTFLDLSVVLGVDKAHLSYYSRTNGNTGTDQIDIGVEGLNLGYTWVSAWYNGSGFSNVLARNSASSVLLNGGTTTDSRGFYQTNKVGTTAKLQRNAAILDTKVDTGNNPTFYGVSIGALNRSVGNSFFSNRECSFSSIGAGLSDTEATNLYNRVQTLMTYFGINV